MKLPIRTLLLFCLTTLFSTVIFADSTNVKAVQEYQEKQLWLGATLLITAEPDYRPGETGVFVNVLPVTAEWAFSNKVGIRIQSMVNMEIKSGQLGHKGGGLTLPVYLSDTWDEGFYVGPYIGFTDVSEFEGNDVTMAIEGGRRWDIGERMIFNLAMQSGVSNLNRAGSGAKRVNHFGIFPSFGYKF